MTEIIHAPGWAPTRPTTILMPSFLPFDASGGGDVHTVLPPEQVLPTAPTIDFWIGDAFGVTLPEALELVPGCNTTPATMTMSFLAPWYTRPSLDKLLTGHAIRGHSHFHLDRPTWLSAGLSDTQAVDLIAYVQSWGFFTSAWKMGTTLPSHTWADYAPWALPLAKTLEDRGLADKHVWVVGEELDAYVVYGEDGLDNIVRQLAARKTFKVAGHFTQNHPCAYGADVADPTGWFRKMSALGYWGNLWQANPSDSAGAQAAHLWDTRKYMGNADPNLKCVAFELIGEEQLYGRQDEAAGRRRGWQSICATRDNISPNCPATAGAGNGLSRPDGTPILKAA